jgi:DNA-binding XRE family transcriptional regulator
MDEYLVDMTAKDIGEMVEMIRIQYIKMHAEPFAKRIGMSEKTLLLVEDGKSVHGLLTLKKINKAFRNVNIRINVELQ